MACNLLPLIIAISGDGRSRFRGKITMCLALYLSASQELPVIAWDEMKPTFHVIRLPKGAEGVRKHFRSEYVYYAGSQQGCSCAFNYEHEYDSIIELRNYLRNALICVEEVEMFACQAGAEARDKRHEVIASPDRIARADFFFKNGQHLVIRPGKDAERVTEAEKCLQRATRVPLLKSNRPGPVTARRATLKQLCVN